MLFVMRGDEVLETLPVGRQPCYVAGRLPEVEITLEHPSVSRRHAAVMHHRSGAVYIMDLGSAHGTFLNGRRLPPQEPTQWREGAAVNFGASSRAFVLRVPLGS